MAGIRVIVPPEAKREKVTPQGIQGIAFGREGLSQ